jgi:oxygen-independent coproporphyrinogen-3 oxidase
LSLSCDRFISPAATSPFSETVTAAYVHIPFCRRRCYYCDFAVSIVGDQPPLARTGASSPSSTQYGTIAAYLKVLLQEIHTTPARGDSLQTVFLGGGTPSLLTAQQVEQILDAIDCQFGIATNAEISMEIDPDTFDREKLQGYLAAGMNRFSLGVQAFQPELLAACGRTHTKEDIDRAVEWLHQLKVQNFSLDLISGLPHQTLDHWQESLQTAIDFNPAHISMYDLTVEPGTAFDRWYEAGSKPLPSDEATAQMYRLSQQVLTSAGYEHYEISNYARSGFQCRHNRVYWENRPYYGFGMGAASYLDLKRFTRPRKRSEYFQWVAGYVASGGVIDCPITPPTEILLDTLMVGLRLAEGLSLTALENQFGEAAIEQVLAGVRPHQQRGWVEITESDGILRIRLSDPEGFLFSNVILSDLFESIG